MNEFANETDTPPDYEGDRYDGTGPSSYASTANADMPTPLFCPQGHEHESMFDALRCRDDDEDLSSCPYFKGEGTCSFGCHTEPACFTDRPSVGWPSEREHA